MILRRNKILLESSRKKLIGKNYFAISNERRTKAEILNNKNYLKILHFIEKLMILFLTQ
ncbi:hypothetical protein LCGC14_0828390 [marine sediment metagenome]|uniref:Uncharacterized protein n=1 Tax=marine sediment metagenome TaxID=412755 RepID=A0A0F9PGQ5_9ZZZZ